MENINQVNQSDKSSKSLIKKILLATVCTGVVVYGGAVAFLQHFDKEHAPVLTANSPTRHDPEALEAFNIISGARCDYCHAQGREMPFYFYLPVAHQLMVHDIKQGLRHFQIDPVLTEFEKGKPPSELQLSQIENVVRHNLMPPSQYLFLHWHAYLTESQRNAILAWIAQTRKRYYANTGAAPQFVTEPVRPIPESVPVNQAEVLLGQKLFFDKNLSGNGTINCASCHDLARGGVDHLVTATGINGHKGPINTPSVYNAYFKIAQFWNGRAPDLAAQAAGPVLNPVEMGSHNWAEVVHKLQADKTYQGLFQAAFGPNAQIDQKTITGAIAEYEKTLITPNSPFDAYLKGDEKAISPEAKRGYELFKDLGCASCHNGIGVGGGGYEIMGLEGNYFKDRGGPFTAADKGRYTVTGKPLDMSRFVVPNLRNVALTAPYFHDGSVKTLDEAVRKMARYQLGMDHLSDQDVTDIVAFLKSLTGQYQGHSIADLPKAVPQGTSQQPVHQQVMNQPENAHTK